MEHQNIVESTRMILQARIEQRTASAIASDLGLSRSWLGKFARGEIVDPGYARVTKLHEYLTAKAS